MIHQRFKKSLLAHYQYHCEQANLEADPARLIDYLIERNLIQPTAVRAHIIREEYTRMCQQVPQLPKQQVVRDLAQRFQVPPRHIQQTVKRMLEH